LAAVILEEGGHDTYWTLELLDQIHEGQGSCSAMVDDLLSGAWDSSVRQIRVWLADLMATVGRKESSWRYEEGWEC